MTRRTGIEHLHENVQCLTEELVTHFHPNPASHYPRVFIDLAANATDTRLRMMAIIAFRYVSFRFPTLPRH
jgi:hypothetical protein